MRRRWLPLVGLFAVLPLLLVGTGSFARATAQEGERERELEESPLAGGWIVTTPDVEGAPPALYTFTAEGNLLQTGPRGVATGVWEPVEDEGAAFTIVFFALDAQGRYIRETVNGTLALGDGDDTFVAVYEVVGVDPDGGETFTSRGASQGERIEVQSMGDAEGTPAADDAEGGNEGVQPDAEVDPDVEATLEGTPEEDEE